MGPGVRRDDVRMMDSGLTRSFDTPLPIDAVLDDLSRALAKNNAAVLVAPPGAGKTTRVPLALLDEPWIGNKKIIVLEPRRIAARASAERMARTLGERVGDTVGYRVRFGSKVSRATRIEVVTEGIFSRQILDDPELTGIAAVLFDEFHERLLDADLGLALARDAQTGLREDLRILVMSATLDGARVARLLGDAPVIASEGRAYPVETRYLGRKPDAPLERQMADAIAMARGFCGGQTMLPDGRLLFAGGTQRYEKLDGAVVNAAGTMTVKNEDPNAPYVLPQGAIFVSPSGQRYRATQSITLPPAAKNGRGRATTTLASEQQVFVEALVPGPAGVTEVPDKYQVEGLPPAQARNVYGQGQNMTLRKQDYQGTNQAYTFDPRTETWARVPDMQFHRWYATLTPMSDGRVLTVAGLDGVGEVLNGQTEIFDPRTNTWSERKDLQHYFPTYPAVFETAQAGQMVYTGASAGYGPAERGREPGLWDTDTNAFTPIPGLRDPDLLETAGSAWLGPVQDQRLAVVGGGGIGESPRSTGRIDMLDLRDPAPHFTPGPTLPEGVRYPNLVNLPDDTMLIANGSRDYRGKGASNNHLAEVLHPDTGALTPVADPTVGRDYHGEALLLPDGRILTAGSDPLFDDDQNLVPGTFEQRIEMFTPPYLFHGARPTVSRAPTTLGRGQTATVATPDAARIRSAASSRPPRPPTSPPRTCARWRWTWPPRPTGCR